MKKIYLLKNANMEPPLVYNKVSYGFKTFCIFDSICELCSSAYSNYNHCKILFDDCKTHDCFVAKMINYLEKADQVEMRLSRLKLCVKYFTCDKGILSCEITIGQLIQCFFGGCFKKNYYIQLESSLQSEILKAAKLQSYIEEYLKKKRNH